MQAGGDAAGSRSLEDARLVVRRRAVAFCEARRADLAQRALVFQLKLAHQVAEDPLTLAAAVRAFTGPRGSA